MIHFQCLQFQSHFRSCDYNLKTRNVHCTTWLVSWLISMSQCIVRCKYKNLVSFSWISLKKTQIIPKSYIKIQYYYTKYNWWFWTATIVMQHGYQYKLWIWKLILVSLIGQLVTKENQHTITRPVRDHTTSLQNIGTMVLSIGTELGLHL